MSDAFEKAYQREKLARMEAEKLLEKMSRELFLKAQALEEANEGLKKNQQTLIQQEKMASVGYLASGIAHEINNPLGYSLSNLAVLKEYIAELSLFFQSVKEQGLPDAVDEQNLQNTLDDMPDLIAETIEGMEAVKQIVGDLRGFARGGGAPASEAQINDGIQMTLNVMKGQLKHKVSVQLDLAELPPIDCYIGKLNQVFANIIGNAVQAMPEGGNLYVSSSVEGERIVIEISDDGPGVPPEVANDIFSPFFTTKVVGEGTGLGLSICYAIVTEDHRGSLTLSDQGLGNGATFRIELPIS